MRSLLLCLLLGALCLTTTATAAAVPPVRVIFDTDMGNDIDDGLALAMLHALETRGEVKLLAVTITKDNKWAAPFVDLVNTFYGRGDIPIGVVRGGGKTPEDSSYIRVPSERKRADGQPVHPHDLRDGARAPDAVEVLRRALAREPDGSVTIIQVGFSTNLSRLLDSAPDKHSPFSGVELARRKVRLLCVMAGAFPSGSPEYNVQIDREAAHRVFTRWPTVIVASGFEIGEKLLYPASSIEKHYGYVANHPVAEAYRLYQKMPYDRPTWDLSAVLYAVRPDEGYFDRSPPGRITVEPDGKTRFAPVGTIPHYYLTITDKQRPAVREAMIQLSSQPPAVLRK